MEHGRRGTDRSGNWRPNLLQRLRDRFAPGALLHFGQGKWYPGESLPRWALSCYWRTRRRTDLAKRSPDRRATDSDYGHTADDAEPVRQAAGRAAGCRSRVCPAGLRRRVALPGARNGSCRSTCRPEDSQAEEPRRAGPAGAGRSSGAWARSPGYVLPLQRQWWQAQAEWVSGPWPIRSEAMFLLPGDSPIGLRLPLDSLPWLPPDQMPVVHQLDPTAPRAPLPRAPGRAAQPNLVPPVTQRMPTRRCGTSQSSRSADRCTDPSAIIRTALCVEPRDGPAARLHAAGRTAGGLPGPGGRRRGHGGRAGDAGRDRRLPAAARPSDQP